MVIKESLLEGKETYPGFKNYNLRVKKWLKNFYNKKDNFYPKFQIQLLKIYLKIIV
jgi:hypothetical protein